MILATLALAALLSSARVVPPVVPIVDPAAQVVALVNAERASQHLDPLTVSAALTRSAQRYADQMAASGTFSHVGPDGSTVATRAASEGYDSQVGETIAAGQTSAGAVVAAWMASPSHRLTLLSPWVRVTGVGFSRSDSGPYRTWWVEDLGTVAPAAAPVFLSKEYVELIVREQAASHRVSGDLLVRIVRCESGSRYNAVGDNGHSVGPAQINDHGLGPRFAARGFARINVFQSAVFLAEEVSAGRGSAWSCYGVVLRRGW